MPSPFRRGLSHQLSRVVAWGLLALAVVVIGVDRRPSGSFVGTKIFGMPMDATLFFLALWIAYVVILEGVVTKSWRSLRNTRLLERGFHALPAEDEVHSGPGPKKQADGLDVI